MPKSSDPSHQKNTGLHFHECCITIIFIKALTTSEGGQLLENSPNNWIDIDFVLQDRHKDGNYPN